MPIFRSIKVDYMKKGGLCQGKNAPCKNAPGFVAKSVSLYGPDNSERVNLIDLASVFQYSSILFHSLSREFLKKRFC